MKRFFLIQDNIGQEKFLEFLSKTSLIPLYLLKEKYLNENQILIDEHYFKNIWENLFKKDFEDYEYFINNLDESIDEILDLSKGHFEVFKYDVI